MAMQKTKKAGSEWAEKARDAGFSVSGNGGIVSLHRAFAPGDRAAYVATECEAYSLLRDVPRVGPGSVWGSTSDGIGGHVALTSGSFVLKCSGASKNFSAGV